jgi:acyl-CoA dehydrogenase
VPSSITAVFPRTFAAATSFPSEDPYLSNLAAKKLLDFFAAKGLAAMKDEDRSEKWYDDWLAYQAKHRIYASVLSPRAFSTLGYELDLLRLTRFLEVFAFFSPAHGYSLQVSFLGLFPILMGTQPELKREAVAALEAGALFALGVSEKDHGSDLLATEFTLKESESGEFIANGRKHYIGNANCATIISVLARIEALNAKPDRARRAPLAFFALRTSSPAYGSVKKIRTIGIRQAYVGSFQVKDHTVTQNDFFAEGRKAWDAVFGTVTLGKFFLGFGSIGICQRALDEALTHMRKRVLYGKPVIDMPHIRMLVAHAYARLLAMKLYAYRALDYIRSANPDDRRYLLYCAVQKAKVSTEGVKVISLLSECIGAKGFESDTWFETALRDTQLIPSLEGSTHINLNQAAQFIPRYLAQDAASTPTPPSLLTGDAQPGENPYLFEARTGGINTIAFPNPWQSFAPMESIPNVPLFMNQLQVFASFQSVPVGKAMLADDEGSLLMGKCISLIAYAQLIVENAALVQLRSPELNAIFEMLVNDLSTLALALATSPLSQPSRAPLEKMIVIPQFAGEGWQAITDHVNQFANPSPG